MSLAAITSNITGNTFSAQGDIKIPITIQTSQEPLGLLKPVSRASYQTRYGAEGDEPHGCMEGTRVHILAELEAWARDDIGSKVYWLHGLLGTGKTSIADTFCKRLKAQEKLGASFFCSRSALNDVTHIIPTISNMLAQSNSTFRSAILKVFSNTPDVADFNSMSEQFSFLIMNPIKLTMDDETKSLIIVIDAIDECSAPAKVEMLIKTVLEGVADIPLKFFITSRPEPHILKAFRGQSSPSTIEAFTEISLQEATQDDVRTDIRTYLKTSLSGIAAKDPFSRKLPDWPSPQEFSILFDLSAELFIYAATAVRYIGETGEDYRDRLTDITHFASGHTPPPHTQVIDLFYKHIVDRAFSRAVGRGRLNRTNVLATVVCLQKPLSVDGIASLLKLETRDVQVALSTFQSVIHAPDIGHVNIFHASFRDFIGDQERCPDNCVDYTGHQMLTIKCLQVLNSSLRRNICDLPEERIGSLPHEVTNLSVISEALRYSCLYWASHLLEALTGPREDAVPSMMLDQLNTFGDEHLLHWFECLSALGELESGVKSLRKAKEAISKYSKIAAKYVLLFEDARRCLQMGFEPIKHHCLNTYRSALLWIPKQSVIRQLYATSFSSVSQARVVVGLADSWGPSVEHVLRHTAGVSSVNFSPDSRQIVSGSEDGSARIWNLATGEAERVLEGHLDGVWSVAFSPDGTRIVSSSGNSTIRIWNAISGEIECINESHSLLVFSVAFSPDGTRIVSGSADSSVRILNANTGTSENILEGHSDWVTSVTFSPDGMRVVSGSKDKSVRIWNAITGEMEQELKGHSDPVTSVAFSPNGKHVASGSADRSVWIWNTTTWKVERILEGQGVGVESIAFSPDGTHLVSGSSDNSVRIWNATIGKFEYKLEGHSDYVSSVSFSPDGTRIVSGSEDSSVRVWTTGDSQIVHGPVGSGRMKSSSSPHGGTHFLSPSLKIVRIWNAIRGKSEDHSWVTCIAFSPDGTRVAAAHWTFGGSLRIWNTSTGKAKQVMDGFSPTLSVAFSPDGTRIVSGSNGNWVRIFDAATGKLKGLCTGHSRAVSAVAFSYDGAYVVSGSHDLSVRIWNTATEDEEHRFDGHSDNVLSVAFSADGTRVVSSSADTTIRIWNTTTGKIERTLEGHTSEVRSATFVPDGLWVISGALDHTVRIWDTVTGEPTVLPERESIPLSDGSIVTHIFPGFFQLLAPGEQKVSLSYGKEWILTNTPFEACAIPPEFRGFCIHAFSSSKVCFGYVSGLVVIVDLDPKS